MSPSALLYYLSKTSRGSSSASGVPSCLSAPATPPPAAAAPASHARMWTIRMPSPRTPLQPRRHEGRSPAARRSIGDHRPRPSLRRQHRSPQGWGDHRHRPRHRGRRHPLGHPAHLAVLPQLPARARPVRFDKCRAKATGSAAETSLTGFPPRPSRWPSTGTGSTPQIRQRSSGDSFVTHQTTTPPRSSRRASTLQGVGDSNHGVTSPLVPATNNTSFSFTVELEFAVTSRGMRKPPSGPSLARGPAAVPSPRRHGDRERPRGLRPQGPRARRLRLGLRRRRRPRGHPQPHAFRPEHREPRHLHVQGLRAGLRRVLLRRRQRRHPAPFVLSHITCTFGTGTPKSRSLHFDGFADAVSSPAPSLTPAEHQSALHWSRPPPTTSRSLPCRAPRLRAPSWTSAPSGAAPPLSAPPWWTRSPPRTPSALFASTSRTSPLPSLRLPRSRCPSPPVLAPANGRPACLFPGPSCSRTSSRASSRSAPPRPVRRLHPDLVPVAEVGQRVPRLGQRPEGRPCLARAVVHQRDQVLHRARVHVRRPPHEHCRPLPR